MTKDEAMKLALEALVIAEAGLADIGDADREPDDDLAWCEARAAEALAAPRAAITALRQAIQEAALQKLTDIHQEMEQKPVAWWNPDESGLSFQKLRGDWQPLYAAPVHAIDINQKHVDETAKDKHEPDAYGDGNVYRGQRSKDSTTKTLHYTAPPKREWVGLTDEDRYKAIRPLYNSDENARLAVEHSNDEYEAIEAKLKEKNT